MSPGQLFPPTLEADPILYLFKGRQEKKNYMLRFSTTITSVMFVLTKFRNLLAFSPLWYTRIECWKVTRKPKQDSLLTSAVPNAKVIQVRIR